MSRAKKTGPPPTSVVLRELSDSNMAGDIWTWKAVLNRRKDGSFTCDMRQEVVCGTGYRPRGLVGFRRGAALYEYLHPAWEEHTGEPLSEDDWEDIADEVEMLDERLAGEVRKHVCSEFHPPVEVETRPTAVELHAQKATWPYRVITGAGGMAAAIHTATRRRAALVYAQRYLETNGRLPTGEHQVELQMGPGKDFIGPLGLSQTGPVSECITYPQTDIPEQ